MRKARVDANQVINITVWGNIPTKKNRLAPRKHKKGGRGYYNPDKAVLEGIEWQIVQQVGSLEPLENPHIAIWFTYKNWGADRDGKLTTLLDCMKNAGILKDDNTMRCNGHLYLFPVKRGEDHVRVRLVA